VKLISEIILHFIPTSYIVQNGWADHIPGNLILLHGRYSGTQDMQLYHRADTPHSLSRNSYHRDDIAYLSTRTLIFDIFVNCNWLDTRWQYYRTHLHINNKQNDTHNNTQNNTNILEVSGPCPVFASYTLAFALQLRKMTEKPQSG
jgi:hypothetical protein